MSNHKETEVSLNLKTGTTSLTERELADISPPSAKPWDYVWV